MKSYPTDVVQNFNVQTGPPQLGPVATENWRMFAPLEDAQAGLGMIDGATDRAVMVDATAFGGIYSQFVYLDPASTIRARIVVGTADDAQGRMTIMEYPSDIFDRDTNPLPMIDKFTPGQPHVLKVQRITPEIGQLFWAATETAAAAETVKAAR
jgi:hypothetical protein